MAKKEQSVTDEQWKKLEPLLPQYQPSPKGGRKPDNRKVFEGITWVLRSGALERLAERISFAFDLLATIAALGRTGALAQDMA